ncbi:MAG: 30S ribosomal protein S6 [Clostridiales bacterium]|nr:30S ribosomal protein S6 [Clostridiales bacterium]MCF8022490.1 30S ribosomal protein S6 [Clostridiales bacterium]
MREYELLYILKPDLDEDNVSAVIEKFKGIIENNEGEVTNTEKWGKRKLAYEINDYSEGIYVLKHFKSSYQVAQELDRRFKLSEESIRHMIIKKEN